MHFSIHFPFEAILWLIFLLNAFYYRFSLSKAFYYRFPFWMHFSVEFPLEGIWTLIFPLKPFQCWIPLWRQFSIDFPWTLAKPSESLYSREVARLYRGLRGLCASLGVVRCGQKWLCSGLCADFPQGSPFKTEQNRYWCSLFRITLY